MLADTGYRSEAVFEQLAGGPTEVIVSIGREGKQPLKFHAECKPYSAPMAQKLQSAQGQAAYRKRKWIAEPPNGWVKSVLGFRQFSMRGLHRDNIPSRAFRLRQGCKHPQSVELRGNMDAGSSPA